MDPALIGVIGTGSGAIIGYFGVLTTSILTRRREDRTRSYTERKTAYADTLMHFDEAWSRIMFRGQDREFVSQKETVAGIAEVRKMSSVLSLIAPDEIMKLAQDTSEMLIEAHPERAERKNPEYWRRRHALADAMRKDLRK